MERTTQLGWKCCAIGITLTLCLANQKGSFYNCMSIYVDNFGGNGIANYNLSKLENHNQILMNSSEAKSGISQSIDSVFSCSDRVD